MKQENFAKRGQLTRTSKVTATMLMDVDAVVESVKRAAGKASL